MWLFAVDEIKKQPDELYDTFHIEGILPKGPYAWQIGPFWLDILDICRLCGGWNLSSLWIHVTYLPIFVRVASQAKEQWQAFPMTVKISQVWYNC